MTKLNVYSPKGTKTGTTELPKALAEKENLVLLAQAVRIYTDRAHPGLSKVKTRGQVIASKKKIYRQKGTGGARHGARSAHIFVGGGVVHGPTGIKRVLTMPKKMKQKARNIALNIKAAEGKVFVVNNINDLKKTKDAQALVNNIFSNEAGIKKATKVTIVLSAKNLKTALVFRNIENVDVLAISQLNASDVYFSQIVVIDKDAFDETKDLTKKSAKDNEAAKKNADAKSKNPATAAKIKPLKKEKTTAKKTKRIKTAKKSAK